MPVSSRRAAAAIAALVVGGFAIGTTEFVTMGLLPQIAEGIGTDIPTTGHTISAYALGVVVGAPLIAVRFARYPRKGLLMALMGLFTIGNAASALAPGYATMLGARFVTGLPHGAFFGLAALVAASLVKPAHRGRAVGRIMLGIPAANVLGVPATTWPSTTARTHRVPTRPPVPSWPPDAGRMPCARLRFRASRAPCETPRPRPEKAAGQRPEPRDHPPRSRPPTG